MARARVFIDDAVLDRLPDVCVKDGVPTLGGRLTVTQEVGASNRLGILWLLVLLGPVGWLVLLLLVPRDRGERLTVTVPFSDGAHDRYLEARHTRTVSVLALLGGGVALVVLGTVGGARLVTVIGIAASLLALIAGLVGNARIDRTSVGLELDASRRWLTISRVHPDFAQACAVHEAANESARRP